MQTATVHKDVVVYPHNAAMTLEIGEGPHETVLRHRPGAVSILISRIISVLIRRVIDSARPWRKEY